MPGTPPGSRAIKKPKRNQNGSTPKKSPRPPHTPATIRFVRERRNAAPLTFISTSIPFLIRFQKKKCYQKTSGLQRPSLPGPELCRIDQDKSQGSEGSRRCDQRRLVVPRTSQNLYIRRRRVSVYIIARRTRGEQSHQECNSQQGK